MNLKIEFCLGSEHIISKFVGRPTHLPVALVEVIYHATGELSCRLVITLLLLLTIFGGINIPARSLKRMQVALSLRSIIPGLLPLNGREFIRLGADGVKVGYSGSGVACLGSCLGIMKKVPRQSSGSSLPAVSVSTTRSRSSTT